MKLFIFAVRDRASVQFGNPMFLISEGQAVRSFGAEVNRADKDNGLYLYPDDFDLYALGEFDTESGLFSTKVPEQVVAGKSVAIRS